jgi:hypothetical protein
MALGSGYREFLARLAIVCQKNSEGMKIDLTEWDCRNILEALV